VVGSGALEAASGLTGAHRVWWADTPTSPAVLAGLLAPLLAPVHLLVLPASPDGRDLAPHLAARLGHALLAGAVRVGLADGRVTADLLRADGRVVVPASPAGPALATLWPGSRGPAEAGPPPVVTPLDGLSPQTRAEAPAPTVEVAGLVEPDPATMDLADARRVLAGGAGLVPEGWGDDEARALFALLADVAAALGASAGATRVVTDAGWMGYDRQIGTTGVTLDPELYVAFGISGASQHVGGIGDPARTVSVNLDASCPMTGLADLGLVSDATGLLIELAGRLGVPVPSEVMDRTAR
jgi:electron transfer flavoprotein alpha subunit